ncbi:MAG: LCP family protein [Thermoleophilia bacterium]|nr:LCP family protein [Thermoleophilia bacterium]
MPPDLTFTDKPYTVYTVEKRRRRRWPRVLLITLLLFVAVVAMAVGGIYLWLDLKVSKTISGPNTKAIHDVLITKPVVSAGTEATVVEPPNAQNILLIGSDNREAEGEPYGRSDTLMLVHIDPEQNFVSVLSLPRDLRVEIPGHGVQKINAAYALKGAELSIKTVQAVTRVDLDHYVNVDFDAFRQLTTELGGIYVDVDRRYYYVGDNYETINIWPGYQALAGESALDYVRFRHDNNNDFGRIQRQQRFLRAAKEQVSKWDAALKIPALVDVLARNVTTDMSTTQVLRLAVWGMRLQGGRVKQVELSATTANIGGGSYVIASDDAIREAVRDLMTPPGSSEPTPATTESGSSTTGTSEGGEGPTTTTGAITGPVVAKVDLSGVAVDVRNGNGRPGEAATAASWLRGLGADIGTVGNASSAGISSSRMVYPKGDKASAKLVARALGIERLELDSSVDAITVVLGAYFVVPKDFTVTITIDDLPYKGEYIALRAISGIPLMAPSYLPDGSKRRDGRSYSIQTSNGLKRAVKVVYDSSEPDQPFGLMATTFADATAASAGREIVVDGVTYTVVTFGGKVDRVWWKGDGVLYWLSNTISSSLSLDEMVKTATGMVPVP